MDTKAEVVQDDGHLTDTLRDETFEAIDPAEEKVVRRKLDTHVLPLMVFVYFCMCRLSLLSDTRPVF